MAISKSDGNNFEKLCSGRGLLIKLATGFPPRLGTWARRDGLQSTLSPILKVESIFIAGIKSWRIYTISLLCVG